MELSNMKNKEKRTYVKIKGILLKDGLINYIYSCEEKKQLLPFEDKTMCKQYATMVAKLLDMDANELALFFGKQEYVNSKKVK